MFWWNNVTLLFAVLPVIYSNLNKILVCSGTYRSNYFYKVGPYLNILINFVQFITCYTYRHINSTFIFSYLYSIASYMIELLNYYILKWFTCDNVILKRHEKVCVACCIQEGKTDYSCEERLQSKPHGSSIKLRRFHNRKWNCGCNIRLIILIRESKTTNNKKIGPNRLTKLVAMIF